MDRSPADIHRLRLEVDGSTEDIKHPGNNLLPDRNPERSSGVLDWHASRQTLCRRQRDSADLPLIELGHDFNDDVLVHPSAENGEDRRKGTIEANIDDTPAYSYDRAAI